LASAASLPLEATSTTGYLKAVLALWHDDVTIVARDALATDAEVTIARANERSTARSRPA